MGRGWDWGWDRGWGWGWTRENLVSAAGPTRTKVNPTRTKVNPTRPKVDTTRAPVGVKRAPMRHSNARNRRPNSSFSGRKKNSQEGRKPSTDFFFYTLFEFHFRGILETIGQQTIMLLCFGGGRFFDLLPTCQPRSIKRSCGPMAGCGLIKGGDYSGPGCLSPRCDLDDW